MNDLFLYFNPTQKEKKKKISIFFILECRKFSRPSDQIIIIVISCSEVDSRG